MEEFVKYTNFLTGIISLIILLIIQSGTNRKELSRKILSSYFFLFGIFWIASFSYFNELILYEYAALITYTLNLIYYPLLFLYLISLTKPAFKIRVFHLVYFVPFLIFAIIFCYYFLTFQLNGIYNYDINTEIRSNFRNEISFFHKYSLYVNLIQFFFYVCLMLIVLKKHKGIINETFSFEKNISLRWFKYFLIFLLIFWLFDNFYDHFIGNYENATFLLLIVRFVFNLLHVLFLGIFGLNQSSIYKKDHLAAIEKYGADLYGGSIDVFDFNSDSAKNNNFRAQTKDKAYSALTYEKKLSLMSRIDDLMLEKKIYRDPQLSIYTVANELFTNIKYISVSINEVKKMNFNTYINSYRIEEVKYLLRHNKELGIPEIIELCGFKSRSAFNLFFKKETGMTPSEFRNMNQNQD
jgi:AraC-like DNA-binding protein